MPELESLEATALRWKRAALTLHERMGAAHYGLAQSRHQQEVGIVRVVTGLLKQAMDEFERANPPDDPEAGWNMEAP
jgi:hypothetical protein